MKFKKLFAFIFLVMTCTFFFSISVSADMGPKPTSLIEIVGIDEPYYFDLLVYYNRTIEVLTDEEISEQISYDYYASDYPEILNGYQDDEGFASYTLYTPEPHHIGNTSPNEFFIGYYMAPSVFKIVIVTESNNVFVSDTVTRNYFSAHFIYDLSNDSVFQEVGDQTDTYYDDIGMVTEDFPYFRVIATALLGVFITLIVELSLLYVAKYREKQTYKIALIVNVSTQLILNLCVFFGFALWSAFAGIGILLLGEFIVFVSEMIAYKLLFKEKQWLKPIPYAILANLASLILGWTILLLISDIFY